MSVGRVFVREESVAGRTVRLRGFPLIDKPLDIGAVEISDAETGLWLGNVSMLASEFPTRIRLNNRHLESLKSDQPLLITAAEQFRNDIRQGKVKPCTE